MADKKISQLTNITGADVVDSTDELAIVDASTNETKAITREELFKSVGGATFNGSVSLGDNDQILLGASNDLTIEHNATNGVITNNTNNLYVANTANDKDVSIQTDDGSGGITNYFLADGSTGEAKMHYYGSEKLKTQSGGVDITGTVTPDSLEVFSNSNTPLANVKLGRDASQYMDFHGGSSGNFMTSVTSTGNAKPMYLKVIEGSDTADFKFSGDGNLLISGSLSIVSTVPKLEFTDTSTGVDHEIDANSGVGNLVINADVNSEGSEPKLLLKVTGTTGITVRDTGNVDIAGDLGVSGNISLGDTDDLRLGDSNDLILEHNGSNGDIRNSTNDLLIRNLADDRDVRILSDDGSGGTADYFRADGSTGEAMLYFYGSEKLATKSTGVDVTGTVNTDKLEVFSNSNTPLGNVKLGRASTQYIDFHGGSSGNFMTSVSTSGAAKPLYLRVNAGATNEDFIFGYDGNLTVPGALSKGSGSFKIDHPLKPTSHHLVHSFVEAPQADNIYRGKVSLVAGAATVNLDEAGRMTEGTFVALNGNIQCFTTNEDGWTAVRGSVSGNTLTIEAQDASCADTVSWLVIGERHDQHMLDTGWTDAAGRVITEPEKQTEEDE